MQLSMNLALQPHQAMRAPNRVLASHEETLDHSDVLIAATQIVRPTDLDPARAARRQTTPDQFLPKARAPSVHRFRRALIARMPDNLTPLPSHGPRGETAARRISIAPLPLLPRLMDSVREFPSRQRNRWCGRSILSAFITPS